VHPHRKVLGLTLDIMNSGRQLGSEWTKLLAVSVDTGMKLLLAAVIYGALGAGPVQATIGMAGITYQTNRAIVSWTGEIGRRYEVQSAAIPSGPWRNREVIVGSARLLTWVDENTPSVSQQFYRVSTADDSQAATPTDRFFVADFAPKAATLLGEQMGELGAGSVFLASQLGAGGLRLVTTGTLNQLGQVWNYTPAPADRLIVNLTGGTNVSFYISRMQGDFSADATTFLQRSHNFDYRAVVPGINDVAFTSDVRTGTPSFQATARGTVLWSNVTYSVDLVLSGLDQFDIDSSGSSYLNDSMITGTIRAPGLALLVNQRRRFESVVAQVNFGGATRYDSATADHDWINNTLTVGADTYQWVNALKQKSFKNGKPSSVDTFWKASGDVQKNGRPFGTYQLRADSVLGSIRFYLAAQGELIELEAWNAL
jgi:hypothetical protein